MDILETHAYDRRRRRNTSCVLCLALLPFFVCTCVYFHLGITESSPSPFAVALKCGPVLSLTLLVLCYNGVRSLGGVAGGLVLSLAGDACLLWPERFLHGMACFGAAHLLYCAAFLSQRYSSRCSSSSVVPLLSSVALWATGGAIYYHILPFVQQNPNAGVLVPAVATYTLLIVTMATLAVRTRRPLTVAGSVAFMVSDLSLALQVFRAIEPSAGGTMLVMATYYLAQLLLSVGDVSAGAEQEDGLGKRKRV